MKKGSCVILDSNIWVSERLLQSTVAHALLYTMTKHSTALGLPEIVEMEIIFNYKRLAEKAMDSINEDAGFLSQLLRKTIKTGVIPVNQIVPSIEKRISELSPITFKLPFSEAQARAALVRLIEHHPPSHERSNEQFRDSCIWEAALSVCNERHVYLVTADKAFYQTRDYSSGLSSILLDEIKKKEGSLAIFPSVAELLNASGEKYLITDLKDILKQKILEAIVHSPHEEGLVKDIESWIREARLVLHSLKGFNTPEPSILAVYFDVRYEVLSTDASRVDRRQSVGILQGTCSFDTAKEVVSEIQIIRLSRQLPRANLGLEDLTFGSSRDEEEDDAWPVFRELSRQ